VALPTQCNLCFETAENQHVLTPHVYGDVDKNHAFFKCAVCDAIYLYPQLNAEQEYKFYAKEFENFMGNRAGEKAGWNIPEKHIQANEQQFQRRWLYLKNHIPTSGKILEMGCSSGFMLFPLREKGYHCSGIEPSGYFSEYLKSQDIPLFENIESVNETYDIVMHFFVLEHVRDPLNFIKTNLKLLKPNGKLIIEIPNAADPLYTIYNISEFEKFYWSIAHHWYFTEKSISYLLKEVPNISYRILRDQRYDLSNHMIWARDGKPGGMGRFSDKLGENFNEAYKKTLIDSGYCDTLVLILENGN